MPRGLRIGVLFVLAGAIAIQFGARRKNSAGKGKHLNLALPAQVHGWVGRDIPLGPTETVRGAVEKTLRYDDVLNREYRSARGVVTIYAAYWGPGSMPIQLVASHTPDRCWVENGWRCEASKHQQGLVGFETTTRAGEWRIFSAPDGQKLHVQFWHLVGGEIYDYGDRSNTIPSVWRWWRDASRQVFWSPAEQYFIRLSSDRPFPEMVGDVGWGQLLTALAKLGLAPKPTGEPKG